MDLSNAGRTDLNIPYPDPIQWSYTLLPVGVNLAPGSTSVEFPNVIGIASAGPTPVQPSPGWLWNGPDGGTNPTGLVTNILSWNGISGVLADTYLPLMGVFLSDSQPVTSTLADPGTAPPRLDFTTIGTNFTSLSPTLGQSFIIGDGKTDSGVVQQFNVPAGATRLYLGFLDCNTFGWTVPGISPAYPSAYWDNAGLMTVTVSVSGAESAPAISTTATAASHVGTYAINVAPVADSNYTITY